MLLAGFLCGVVLWLCAPVLWGLSINYLWGIIEMKYCVSWDAGNSDVVEHSNAAEALAYIIKLEAINAGRCELTTAIVAIINDGDDAPNWLRDIHAIHKHEIALEYDWNWGFYVVKRCAGDCAYAYEYDGEITRCVAKSHGVYIEAPKLLAAGD